MQNKPCHRLELPVKEACPFFHPSCPNAAVELGHSRNQKASFRKVFIKLSICSTIFASAAFGSQFSYFGSIPVPSYLTVSSSPSRKKNKKQKNKQKPHTDEAENSVHLFLCTPQGLLMHIL